MSASTSVRRAALPGLLGAALSGTLVVGLAGGASGQDPELVAFSASSSAMGLQVELEVPGAPLSSNLFDGGGPLAQAAIDGLGTSQAFAALPYPGETAATLPNLALPLLGLPALPPYPLQASSQALIRPSDDASLGAVTVRATSEDRMSSAQARAGGGSSGAFAVGNVQADADAAVDQDSLDVTATAESAVESLSVAGVLTLGSARATATAVRGSDGTSDVTSTFDVDGLAVAGVRIGVTPDGLVLPGTTTPVPGTEGLSPVLDPLGISVEVLPEETFEDGVRSRGLAITVPAPGTLAEGRLTLTVGRATASSTATTRDDAVPPASAVEPATGAPSAPVASPAASPLTPSPGPPVLDAAPTAPPTRSTGARATTAAASALEAIETSSFYLVLAGGALAGIVSSSFLRRFGVKLAWTG